MTPFVLPTRTRPGEVHLRTANLDRALGFYQGVLGLEVVRRTASQAALAAAAGGPDFIVLTSDLSAVPKPARCVGLYHLAIRYPGRAHLADAVFRLARHHYPIEGASDHLVSEAIYLSDPDHNGVELYTDRPRDQWVWSQGQVTMATASLDMDDLLASASDPSGQAKPSPATDLGHIHLHVADLAHSERFFHELIGLPVTQRSYPGALFLAAGGYHHHIAVNTWAGQAAPPPNSTGLISYRLIVPESEVLETLRRQASLTGHETRTLPPDQGPEVLQIRDPNGNWLEIQTPSEPRV